MGGGRGRRGGWWGREYGEMGGVRGEEEVRGRE